jgi:predicted Zn-dependent peptidase
MIAEDDVKQRAYRFLLQKMLVSHTSKYQSKQEMSTYLQSLYGASLGGRTSHIGNLNMIHIALMIVNPSMVNEDSLVDKAIDLFDQMIANRTFFSQSIFDHEKRMLIEQWESIEDQKRLYASIHFNQAFFLDHPFGYPESGYLEDIKNTTLDGLKAYFNQVLLTNKKVLVINGFVSDYEEKFRAGLKHLENEGSMKISFTRLEDRKENYINEYLEMNQAIIHLGYHLPIFRKDSLYEAALCFDLMVGGYAESILFKEIREKEGLCYDIRSSYDSVSGTLTIKSGVDLTRKTEAIEKMHMIVNHLENYGLDENALEHAKKYLVHQIKSSYDDQGSLTMRAFFDILYEQHIDLDEKIKRILNVKFSEVLEVFDMLKLQTTYVLSGDKNDR